MSTEPSLHDVVARRRYVLQKPAAFLDRYQELFSPLRDRPATVLELGVHKGDSLRLWAEFLPRATILGVDTHTFADRGYPGELPPNASLHVGRQEDADFLNRLADEYAPEGLDVVIDDCSHHPWRTRASCETLMPRIKPGGAYVLEDWGIGTDVRDQWEETRERVGGTTRHLVGFVKELVDDLISGPGFPRHTYVEALHLYPEIAILRKARDGYGFNGYRRINQPLVAPVTTYHVPADVLPESATARPAGTRAPEAGSGPPRASAGCECRPAGYPFRCERHGVTKTEHWHRLCRTRAEYFRLWEEGRGPGRVDDRTPSGGPVIAPIRDAPLRAKPWEGNGHRKPWSFEVTAAIPVLDTWDTLELVVELLRLQSVRPFVVVVDTGSTDENYRRVEALRSADLEVHCLRLNGVRHPSDFPAMAMDLAFAVCRTRYLLCTHADCFLRKRTLVEEMLELCRTESPAVGYEITPRKHEDWKGMLGHTCTMLDMQAMDRIGAGWSMRRLATLFGIEDHQPHPTRPNWPDTELLLNYLLRQNGVVPRLIGHEENYVRNVDENIDHCRTLTAGLLYNPDYYATARQWADEAMAEARERIVAWRAESEGGYR